MNHAGESAVCALLTSACWPVVDEPDAHPVPAAVSATRCAPHDTRLLRHWPPLGTRALGPADVVSRAARHLIAAARLINQLHA